MAARSNSAKLLSFCICLSAQPPVELMRQWLDHEGWYDTADNSWRSVVDTVLVGAMGTPGGGRMAPSARFVRHFNVIAVPEFDDAAYTRIYSVCRLHPHLLDACRAVPCTSPCITHRRVCLSACPSVCLLQEHRPSCLPTPPLSCASLLAA
jgi:P-loop containing dynein motor region